jgi:hypothetical protein
MRVGIVGMALAIIVSFGVSFGASFGCGRLKPAADAAAPVAIPDADARAPTDTADGPDDPGIDTADATPEVETDTAVPRTGRPLPVDVHAPVRILGADAALIRSGKDACTYQTPASGDGHRWCAFTLGTAVGGLADLWAIDVTRAATGDVAPCDGTDAGCVHLTDKLVTRSVAFFEGDTLFYSTDSVALPGADFLGRIFAWRPGWSGGRQISSDAGFTCIGNVHSAAAACLDDPDGAPAKRDSANVRAGYLLGETGGLLPVFGRYPLRNDNDTAWLAKLSPDGSLFVLSDADTIGAKESLRLAPTGQIGQTAPTLALDDVAYWQISNDGLKIYFLRGSAQRASLYVADFPSGANVTLIESGILSFALIGDLPTDQGVELEKDHPPGGTIELLANRAVTAPKAIFTHDDFLNGAVVSPDLRYTTWLNDPFEGVVFRNSDLSSCAIEDSPVFDPSYLDGAGLMFWEQLSPDSNTSMQLRDAYFAGPETCRDKQRFARHVELVAPIGDRGVVFTDELEPKAKRATLKYIAATADRAALDPAGPVRVHENVTAPIILVGENPPLLVYAAAGDSPATTGFFVFGPVPF